MEPLASIFMCVYIYNTHAVAHTQVTHMRMHTHTHRISNWKREEGEEETVTAATASPSS